MLLKAAIIVHVNLLAGVFRSCFLIQIWCRWIIQVHGAPGTLYEGETFHLQVDFPEHYPMEAPLVQTRQLTTVYSCLSNYTVVLVFMKLVMGGGSQFEFVFRVSFDL